MIRKDIVNNLAKSPTCYRIPRRQIEQIVVELFQTISDTLQNHEDVLIRGFGHFRVKFRKPRVINHPSTGEQIMSPPKHVILFDPARNVKRKLRNTQPPANEGV